MLLANMSVAKIIADAFPDRALLRRHPPPDERKIGELLQLAEDLVSHAAILLFSASQQSHGSILQSGTADRFASSHLEHYGGWMI